MTEKENNLDQLINDPFKGKSGFMPAKIKDEIKVRIGLNENLAFPEELMKKLIKEVAERVDPRIYPEDYCDSLCNLIASDYDLLPNQVVIGNGGDKIIDLMVRLTIKAGFSAAIIAPTYPMYEHAIKVQGGDVTELYLTDAPEYDLDPDYILSNITPKKDRLLFLCSPNNPTGNQFDEHKLRKIIAEFPGIVALDETYTDFGGYSLVNALKDYPNLIIMKSMSKFHGMAGMRLGFALADEFLISRLKELLPAFNVNIASLELAKLVLQEKEALSKIVSNIVSEREIVYKRLEAIDGIIPYKSFTNFIMFRLDGMDAAEIQQKLLKEKGVLVRNMSAIPKCENSLRMSITTKENNLAFLNALEETISNY
ncbi:MAG: histidinol-phosphate aminotransferase family protein [Candidatus Heimdallarchaeota archaeon]|nr:MAG: histidinol-phosphate aminotransferase family protein [Candidatus Heimdallarchaeota archaeon]